MLLNVKAHNGVTRQIPDFRAEVKLNRSCRRHAQAEGSAKGGIVPRAKAEAGEVGWTYVVQLRRCNRCASARPSSVRRRQTVCEPVGPHPVCLVCSDSHVAARFCPAEQNQARRFVLGKERVGITLVKQAVDQLTRAAKATPLMADCGQLHTLRAAASHKYSSSPQARVRMPSGVSSVTRKLRPGTVSGIAPPFTDCRSRGSCCTALRPAHRGGSARMASTCRPAHAPAIQ